MLNNIKNYKDASIFQKYTLNYLIHNFPQLNDVKHSAKLFYQIDENGDGKIAKNELFNGLNALLEKNYQKKNSKTFIKILI